jgi:hypothetical protein
MSLPELPLSDWRATKDTLHRMAQIVGKIRLASTPHRNHWWHVTLYVTPRGLTTGAMPGQAGTFEIELDFLSHELAIRTSRNERGAFSLQRLSVAEFYRQVMDALGAFGIEPKIRATPFDLAPATPFASDLDHATYDPDAVERYFEILRFSDQALQEFAGRFTGKQSPPHLFWHTFDLAMARYSGRRAPDRPEADHVTREAYSHEVISFGFWAGDDNMPAPAYYSYTWPEPEMLSRQDLRPAPARWADNRGSSLALLTYDDVRTVETPRATLLDFFESCYEAGSRTAGWDVEDFRTVRFD